MSTNNTETPRVAKLKPCPTCKAPCEVETEPARSVFCVDDDGVPYTAHHLAISTYRHRLAHQPTNADELVETLYNLSARAGKLVTATDGQEQWRTERQAVLDAMRGALKALSRPRDHAERIANRMGATFVPREQSDALPMREPNAAESMEPILEKLREIHRRHPDVYLECCSVIDSIRALSRPLEEGEPVAWIDTEQLAALSVKHDFFPPVSARKMDEFETPLYAHPTAGKVIDEQDVERVAIAKRFKVTRKMEDDPFGKTLPKWTRNLAFGFYREQGWRACDQRKGGKTVATGAWGDELFLLTDGSFACTKYPNGYPSFAALQPSPGALGERDA